MNDEYGNRYDDPYNQEPPPPPYDSSVYGYGEPSADAKSMAMLCHLLAVFLSFVGPLVIWLIKKDTEPFVDDQGKEALNFQLAVLVVLLAAGLLTGITCGVAVIVTVPVMILVGILDLVFCIIAAVQASRGVVHRYPMNIRFIK